MPRTGNVPWRSEGGAARELQRTAAILAAAPASAPHHDALQVGGTGASGVTVTGQEEETENAKEAAARGKAARKEARSEVRKEARKKAAAEAEASAEADAGTEAAEGISVEAAAREKAARKAARKEARKESRRACAIDEPPPNDVVERGVEEEEDETEEWEQEVEAVEAAAEEEVENEEQEQPQEEENETPPPLAAAPAPALHHDALQVGGTGATEEPPLKRARQARIPTVGAQSPPLPLLGRAWRMTARHVIITAICSDHITRETRE